MAKGEHPQVVRAINENCEIIFKTRDGWDM
jgi:hypothetical protein